ncbi:MAG: hypothetical protein WAK01_01840, partial [Methylocystis sp.]
AQTAQGGAGGAGAIGGNGGNASSTLTFTDSAASTINATTTAIGGAGGAGATAGLGGLATSTVVATTTLGAKVNATAKATAGANGDGLTTTVASSNATVNGASAGFASAQSNAVIAQGSVSASATSPVGGPASAGASAGVVDNFPGTLPTSPGESYAFAVLHSGATPFITIGGQSTYGFGGVSIGYGGTGEALTYQTSTAFNFTTPLSGHLGLNFFDPTFLGSSIVDSTITISVNGVEQRFYNFSSLSSLEHFFANGGVVNLGAFYRGGSSVEVDFSETLNAPGSGVSFLYDLGSGPTYSAPGPGPGDGLLGSAALLAFLLMAKVAARDCRL